MVCVSFCFWRFLGLLINFFSPSVCLFTYFSRQSCRFVFVVWCCGIHDTDATSFQGFLADYIQLHNDTKKSSDAATNKVQWLVRCTNNIYQDHNTPGKKQASTTKTQWRMKGRGEGGGAHPLLETILDSPQTHHFNIQLLLQFKYTPVQYDSTKSCITTCS